MAKILLLADYFGKSNLCSDVDLGYIKVSIKTAFFEQATRPFTAGCQHLLLCRTCRSGSCQKGHSYRSVLIIRR